MAGRTAVVVDMAVVRTEVARTAAAHIVVAGTEVAGVAAARTVVGRTVAARTAEAGIATARTLGVGIAVHTDLGTRVVVARTVLGRSSQEARVLTDGFQELDRTLGQSKRRRLTLTHRSNPEHGRRSTGLG